MRTSSVIATVLCILVSGCDGSKDTAAEKLWPRTTEVYVPGASAHPPCRALPLKRGEVVQKVACAAPAEAVRCDDVVRQEDALRLMAQCPDAAVALLEQRNDPNALAAAYYVRAQQHDRADDLLHAHESAITATRRLPLRPAAFFNRALIEEALGLRDQAIESWRIFEGMGDPERVAEGRARRTRLERERQLDASVQWPIARARIDEALRARDVEQLEKVVRPFPSAVEAHLFEVLLPQWAEAPSEQRLDELRFLATHLSRLSNDPYAVDVVHALRDSAAMREGLAAYKDAAMSIEQLDVIETGKWFTIAIERLSDAASPLRLLAETRLAYYLEPADALPRLERLRLAADAGQYTRLRMLVHATRAHVLAGNRQFLNALEDYDAGVALADRSSDPGERAHAHARRAALLGVIGQSELAWRDMLSALRFHGHMHRLREHHRLQDGAAGAAIARGRATTALVYSDNVLAVLRRAVREVPPQDLHRLRGLQKQLAIAHVTRASAYLRLGEHAAAAVHLREATRLDSPSDDEEARRLLGLRRNTLDGQNLIASAPLEAIEKLTTAIALAQRKDLLRATLYAERARAKAKAQQDPESDLLTALQELDEEEERTLLDRKRGTWEELWRDYFGRFDSTYRLLIGHYLSTARPQQAFQYAERARAYELLSLIRRSPNLPRSLRAVAGVDERSVLARAMAELPPDTFLLQYVVLEERTHVFLIGRNTFAALPLEASRAELEKWRAAVQRAVTLNNWRMLNRALMTPYERLVAEPLQRILEQTGGRVPHLVFVPDGPMHGLPLSALRDRRAAEYLIQKAVVSVAPSTTLYLYARERDADMTGRGDASLLLVGNPQFDEELPLATGLDRLPHAETEVQDIAALHGDAAQVLVGAEATVPAFLAGAQNKSIVHLAAHSIVNAEQPWQSLLLLARSPDHSGALTAQELLTTLQSNETRLMVLATCSSAGGLPVGPEGVAPLVRAILGAGVPAVIGSLWEVEDATAAQFLVSFHCHYKAGSNAAEALRTTTVKLLEKDHETGRRSVLTWAPYQVIGQASSPFAAPRTRGTHNGLHPSHSLQRSDHVCPQ